MTHFEEKGPAEAAQKHFNRGREAANAGDFKKAICEYKAALELHPDAGLETITCWNCAFAIWHRPGFWEKTGVTQSEYRDILALRALLIRVVSIYEKNFRGNPKLEAAFGRIYQDAKKELDHTKGRLVIIPDGELRVPMMVPETTPDWFHLKDWFEEQQCDSATRQLERMTLGDLIWWLPDELNPPKSIAEIPLSSFEVKGITQTTLASLQSVVWGAPLS